MRKVIASMAVLLLGIPALASAQVKTRTHAGAWDEKPKIGAYKAPVKTGTDIELNFKAQIETDFEWRLDYDFNDKSQDGSGGGDGSATVDGNCRGFTSGGTPFNCSADGGRVGQFVEQETRWGMQARTKDIGVHIMAEQEELFTNAADGGDSRFHIERAFGDIDLGIFNFRAGLEWYTIDPARMVYSDDDWGARIYKDYGDVGWSVRWIKRVDDDNVSLGTDTGTDTRDHDVFMVSGEVALDNPLDGGTMSIIPFYHFSWDRTRKEARTAAMPQKGDIQNHILGASIFANLGPVRSVLQGAFGFGEDKTGLNGINISTGVPVPRENDIRNWMLYAEFAYPIPNSPVTVGFGTVIGSGDDDPFDSDSSGWTNGYWQDTALFQDDGIWADDNQTIRFADCETIQDGRCPVRLASASDDTANLTEDDSFMPTGLNAISLIGDGTSGFANYANPGIQYYNFSVDYKMTKELAFSLDLAYIRLMTGDFLNPVDNIPVQTNVGPVNVPDKIDKEVGFELGFGAKWRPAKYMSVTPVFSFLFPGDAIKDVVGNDTMATNIYIETMWTF